MTTQRRILVSCTLTLGVLLAARGLVVAQPLPPPPGPLPVPAAAPTQDGVETLARGPIHEAFAEPVDTQPQPPLRAPQPPPTPLEELPPDQRPQGEDVQWMPGYWNWDEDRSDFVWVSGFWRAPPPGRRWVPGRWAQAGGGWQWVPGFWTATTQVQYLPAPPAPVADAAVPAPAADSILVPGSWVWRETRYLWRPAYWIEPRPGWVWVPAHFVWTPAGVVFVDGYWDYDLNQRGVLFAPVYVERRVWARPGWCFRPWFTVRIPSLYAALFVRPRSAHYYFGDYFDRVYAGRGYVAWADYRLGRGAYDPLFSYYRWHYRQDRRWETDLRGLYAARTAGTAPRPPRTLVQQQTLVQNQGATRSVSTITTMTVLTPLPQANPAVKLQRISRERQLEEQRAAQQLRDLSRRRDRFEAEVVVQPAPAAGLVLDVGKGRPLVRVADRVPPPLPPAPAVRPAAPPPRTEVRPPPPPPRVQPAPPPKSPPPKSPPPRSDPGKGQPK
jgi:hypothetical protein